MLETGCDNYKDEIKICHKKEEIGAAVAQRVEQVD